MPKKIVGFDFDNTLCMSDGSPNHTMLELVRKYASEGYKCYIVTARDRRHESRAWIKENEPTRVRVKDFIKEHDLPIKQCHFTNHQEKGLTLWQLEITIHYDDSETHIRSGKEYGIEVIHPNEII